MTTTRRKLLGAACAVPAAGLAQKKQKEPPKVLYSRARAWRDLVFLSGHGVADDGGAGVQTKIVLDQIEAELKAAGSAMDKVLKVTSTWPLWTTTPP